MEEKDSKVEAQLIKYFQKVVMHTAINYYKRRARIIENELLVEDSLGEILEGKEGVAIASIVVLGIPLEIDNEKLIEKLKKIKEKEQIFLIEKFIFGKTDKEIGKELGITRQGVTNLKLRLYRKFRRTL
ncbi:hypothetical protein RV11_GL003211 [Enterococcus phoeniculicola]|uniref:Sigma-70 family RNA polymerase sigma factor n=1 Tax=Enterococcus phoeniculicola ATCC BAA-412 TaxID=1158610 RepID=R3WMB3_9ENTE|nr:hypothetical protein [Enterococcus phoeniculicola]EOL42970.1 hypothetical protein UC3_01947 [Enterococcus phoeniculicola ATCC BAA-412]EOT76672.1 hypothetical protein I589_01629 [Enterococcus phoeniculicola ATCC BAA-412]OJG72240.1 hypothetical protein RV11_GL003211 [Enterococcus phoeniculicola]